MTSKKMKLATNQPSEHNVHWSFWCGVSFFIAVIVALFMSGWLLYEKMLADESAPVTSLVISGEMPFTKKASIEQAIDEIALGNFFKVDVNKVQETIASLPWVYSVSVRKQWPNELKVYVVDQSPVAFWNGDFLINHYGEAFQARIDNVNIKLPSFYGPEGTEDIAVENFKNLNTLLAYSDLSIDELMLSERFSWQLTLSDGVTINLGRENRVERIQRFMDAYPKIKLKSKENQLIKYVDLRYDTGLAVGWTPKEPKERV